MDLKMHKCYLVPSLCLSNKDRGMCKAIALVTNIALLGMKAQLMGIEAQLLLASNTATNRRVRNCKDCQANTEPTNGWAIAKISSFMFAEGRNLCLLPCLRQHQVPKPLQFLKTSQLQVYQVDLTQKTLLPATNSGESSSSPDLPLSIFCALLYRALFGSRLI